MKSQKLVCHQCQQDGKYKLPGTEYYYCSVPCYKALKASQPAQAEESTEPSTEVQGDEPRPSESETLEAPRPLKRLRDLNWPEEPDSSFWADPLKRDELKPLRNFELEAVAKNEDLRKLLEEHPNLPALLQQTFSDPAMPPHVYLRHVMGISTAAATSYVSPNYRGNLRGGRGGRGGPRGHHNATRARGRGRGGHYGGTGGRVTTEAAPPPSQETVQLMHRFADLIKTVLSQARQGDTSTTTTATS